MKTIPLNRSDKIVLLFPLSVISVPILSSDQFEERKGNVLLGFLNDKKLPHSLQLSCRGTGGSQFSLKTIVFIFLRKGKSLKISMYIKLLSFSGSSRGHFRRTVDLLQFY